MDYGEVVISYLETALWSSLDPDDEGGSCLDEDHDLDDVSVDFWHEAARDCVSFCEANAKDLEASGLDEEAIGRNFWLTRNQHGAGFWDRGLGEVGDRLTEAAHVYGEVNLYVTDEGKIEAM